MPFGLANSQGTYQRPIDKALHGCSNAQASVDDTCVYSKDFESHLEHLNEVLERLDRAGFQLRRQKCAFGYAKVEFLGHLISHQGKRPIPSTTLRISQFPRPTARQFLGMVNCIESIYREWLISLNP